MAKTAFFKSYITNLFFEIFDLVGLISVKVRRSSLSQYVNEYEPDRGNGVAVNDSTPISELIPNRKRIKHFKLYKNK